MTSKLLVVETSPRGDASVSRRLTSRFVSDWRGVHPHGEVVLRDLADTDLPHVDGAWLNAYFTPPDRQTSSMKQALHQSDVLVAELLAADHLVIGTPVYNYNVPAVLKAWIDNVVRKGLTLGFDGRGMLGGKKATVLIASGGSYGEGSPIRERDIATHYLRLILGVIGIVDVTFVAGGGAKAVDMGELTMEEFVAKNAAAIGQAVQA
jgi:FMN-dependent NADH-azoreductase